MKNLIETLLRQALAALPETLVPAAQRDIDIEVERTRDASHGDFACNVAMRLAKAARQNPRKIAEAVKSALPTHPAVAKVEIAGAGFINFFLNDDSYRAEIGRVLAQGESYGRSTSGRGKSVLVEFVSANPTGPLHVGHGRGAAYGATIANLLEAVGYRVAREYYINDAGRQMEILAASTWLRYLEQCGERFDVSGQRLSRRLPARHRRRAARAEGTALRQNGPRRSSRACRPTRRRAATRTPTSMRSSRARGSCSAMRRSAAYSIMRLPRSSATSARISTEFGVTFDSLVLSERSLIESGAVDRAVAKLEGCAGTPTSRTARFGSRAPITATKRIG